MTKSSWRNTVANECSWNGQSDFRNWTREEVLSMTNFEFRRNNKASASIPFSRLRICSKKFSLI